MSREVLQSAAIRIDSCGKFDNAHFSRDVSQNSANERISREALQSATIRKDLCGKLCNERIFREVS